MNKTTTMLLYIVIAALVLYWLFASKENFGGTSPGTLIQLSASSGYYPFWRYGYGYRWPYYRFIYPYYANHPAYTSYYQMASYPHPYGWYQAFQNDY